MQPRAMAIHPPPLDTAHSQWNQRSIKVSRLCRRVATPQGQSSARKRCRDRLCQRKRMNCRQWTTCCAAIIAAAFILAGCGGGGDVQTVAAYSEAAIPARVDANAVIDNQGFAGARFKGREMVIFFLHRQQQLRQHFAQVSDACHRTANSGGPPGDVQTKHPGRAKVGGRGQVHRTHRQSLLLPSPAQKRGQRIHRSPADTATVRQIERTRVLGIQFECRPAASAIHRYVRCTRSASHLNGSGKRTGS